MGPFHAPASWRNLRKDFLMVNEASTGRKRGNDRHVGVPAVSSTPPGRSGRQERRPRRIRRVARGGNLLLVATRKVDRVERRPAVTARIAKEHDHAAVRREGRTLVVEPGRQDPLARAVRVDHADRELPAHLLGEGDDIAAGRPYRRRVRSFADRKSTRLNSSHVRISYAVFCLKKKKNKNNDHFFIKKKKKKNK